MLSRRIEARIEASKTGKADDNFELLYSPNENKRSKEVVRILDRDSLQQLLQIHRSLGIGLHHSVGFLCRVQGVELKGAAREAGVSRGLLYLALRGDRRATDHLRRTVGKYLGVDPWCVEHPPIEDGTP